MLGIAVIVSIGFGVARFIVPVSGVVNPADIFKDMAHVWVGILIGIAAVVFSMRWSESGVVRDQSETAIEYASRRRYAVLSRAMDMMCWTEFYVALPLAMTALEVVAFVVRRI